ncbi:hypothetical protein Galf_1503 [Gallionella capsiferriformans ES-2]|uniref:Uncharacterized protein n=1 Tax=Gallionella capsiferriformans (strain ES-2) TaxID=395494 RepID=D9SG75_GALCS|nr:hypothetical protein Galf_1503 [Gallionella capsiferriformans ES-2]
MVILAQKTPFYCDLTAISVKSSRKLSWKKWSVGYKKLT